MRDFRHFHPLSFHAFFARYVFSFSFGHYIVSADVMLSPAVVAAVFDD